MTARVLGDWRVQPRGCLLCRSRGFPLGDVQESLCLWKCSHNALSFRFGYRRLDVYPGRDLVAQDAAHCSCRPRASPQHPLDLRKLDFAIPLVDPVRNVFPLANHLRFPRKPAKWYSRDCHCQEHCPESKRPA